MKRLRLFETCVSRGVLWCCESWLPTQDEKRKLVSVQNDMLRRIVGIRRRPDEDWIPWIIRSTRDAREAAVGASVNLWPEAIMRAKWRWAGHVARMEPSRLCRRTVEWRDSEWCATRDVVGGRPRRPKRTRWFRWEDDLRSYAPRWKDVAQNRDQWKAHESNFLMTHIRSAEADP